MRRPPFGVVLALVVAGGLYAGCRCGVRAPRVCEPDSAALAELTYQGVQAEAAKRGRCVLVCYARHERRICPALDTGADL